MEKEQKKNVHPVLSGLKLGILLQFGGMGPICLLLFQLAAILPFKSVASGIAAVTLADAVYILISLLGIVGIIKQVKSTSEFLRKIQRRDYCLSGIVLCVDELYRPRLLSGYV